VGALIAALGLVLGCQRPRVKPQTQPVQAPPSAPENGTAKAEKSFREGQCAQAIAEYERYLETKPGAPDRDAVLYRIAVCRLLPQSGAYSPDEALSLLKEIAAGSSVSPWRPHAELILSLSARAREGLAALEHCNQRIQGLSQELEKFRYADLETRAHLQQVETAAAKERQDRDVRIRQLTATIGELEEKIRRLTEELDALKKIDLQRRPSRPRP